MSLLAIYKGDCLDCKNSCRVQGYWVCSHYNLIIELIEFEDECEFFEYEDNE